MVLSQYIGTDCKFAVDLDKVVVVYWETSKNGNYTNDFQYLLLDPNYYSSPIGLNYKEYTSELFNWFTKQLNNDSYFLVIKEHFKLIIKIDSVKSVCYSFRKEWDVENDYYNVECLTIDFIGHSNIEIYPKLKNENNMNLSAVYDQLLYLINKS